MPIKSKKDLDALQGVSPEDRADLSALFEQMESLNSSIATLRSEKESADKVVQKMPKLEEQLQEKENLSRELQAKLDALTIKAPNAPAPGNFDDLFPFAELRRSLEELLGDEESPDQK